MYARQIIAFVVLTFSANSLECAEYSAEVQPSKLGKEFRELNKLLTERTDQDEIVESMEIVEKLIPEAESSTCFGFKNKKKLAIAERLFLSLTKLGDKKMCNREGFKISTDNATAIKKAGTPKRVAEIYEFYVELQQIVCFPVLSTMLKEKLATMDQEKLERLDYVMKKSINTYHKGNADANGLFALISMDNVGPEAEKLHDTLAHLPQDTNDSELKEYINSGDFDKLVASRYVVEPCDHFMLNLKDDIFTPASTWMRLHKPVINQYEFYYNWVRFKFCVNANKFIRS